MENSLLGQVYRITSKFVLVKGTIAVAQETAAAPNNANKR